MKNSNPDPDFFVVVSNQTIPGYKDLVELHRLINQVYLSSEKEFWTEGYERISLLDLEGAIRHNRIFIAYVNEQITGCVRVGIAKKGVASFGMLCVHPEFRGLGIAARLVESSEKWALEKGLHRMQLELLLPTGFEHPDKEKLKIWYRKLSYQPKNRVSFKSYYPNLIPLMKINCDFEVWEKQLI